MVAGFSVLAYCLLFVNLPTFLFPGAGHDDGLFMFHAMSIVSGHWLGPYSQFTLMKGPGYPLFLAFISLFRIPVTLAHAMFWGSSIWLLSYATNKLFKSVFLSLTVLEVLLWNFGPHGMRVIRDEISTPQLITAFSFLLLALFALNRSRPLLLASLSGCAFGWFWITREDGVAAVPAILLLFACSFDKAYGQERSIRTPLKALAAFLGSSAAIWIAVAFINLEVYKTFTIVDFGGSYESALEALESVKPDTYTPYNPASRSAREKAYKVSPTFAQLSSMFESSTGPIAGWKVPPCQFLPSACGDYSAWFIWAFRDAVALHGDYSSPQAATTFYRRVHDEITRACHSGALVCYHNALPFVPHMEMSQLGQIRVALPAALKDLSFVLPPPQDDVKSIGLDDQLRLTSSFLSLENHTPPPASEVMTNQNITAYAEQVRGFLIRIYSHLLPLLLLLGLGAGVILLVQCIYSRSYSIGCAISWAAWLATACRVALIVLADVSSFPAVNHLYIGYAYPFVCYASLLSIFLLFSWLAEMVSKSEFLRVQSRPAPSFVIGGSTPVTRREPF